MIASLNIMAKTFAKIVKTFVGLLATIVVKERRLGLILYLEARYAKMDYKNEIYTKKLGKKHLDCKKSTLGKKSMVNPEKVNDQTSRIQMMTSAVDASK